MQEVSLDDIKDLVAIYERGTDGCRAGRCLVEAYAPDQLRALPLSAPAEVLWQRCNQGIAFCDAAIALKGRAARLEPVRHKSPSLDAAYCAAMALVGLGTWLVDETAGWAVEARRLSLVGVA